MLRRKEDLFALVGGITVTAIVVGLLCFFCAPRYSEIHLNYAAIRIDLDSGEAVPAAVEIDGRIKDIRLPESSRFIGTLTVDGQTAVFEDRKDGIHVCDLLHVGHTDVDFGENGWGEPVPDLMLQRQRFTLLTIEHVPDEDEEPTLLLAPAASLEEARQLVEPLAGQGDEWMNSLRAFLEGVAEK